MAVQGFGSRFFVKTEFGIAHRVWRQAARLPSASAGRAGLGLWPGAGQDVRPRRRRAGGGRGPSGAQPRGRGRGQCGFLRAGARNVAPRAGRAERDRSGEGRRRPPEAAAEEGPERDGATGGAARPTGGRVGGPGAAAAGAGRGAPPGEWRRGGPRGGRSLPARSASRGRREKLRRAGGPRPRTGSRGGRGGGSEGPAEVRSGAGRGGSPAGRGRAEGARLRDGGASGTAAVLSRGARRFFPGLCEGLRAAPLPAPSLPAARLRSEGARCGQRCLRRYARADRYCLCDFAYGLLERASVWRRARLSA